MVGYGLALSGGGARGAAHVGVLMALEEEGLLPDNIAGTSAGSVVAGLYAAGIRPYEMKDMVMWLAKHGRWYLDPDIGGILAFLPQMFFGQTVRLSGLFRGKRLTSYLCSLTGGIGIEAAECGVLIPAVDINSGNTIVFTNLLKKGILHPSVGDGHARWETEGKLCEIMMASASVPAVFSPRKIPPYCLVDGGVTNNLPVDLLIAAGVPMVIGVDIGATYVPPPNTCIMETVTSSFAIMSRELTDCRSSGEVLLLKPRLPSMARLLSFHEMLSCMDSGYQYTRKKMPEIRGILKNT